MVYDYDKLYGSRQQALGKPTQVFVDFFERKKMETKRVLDVGCGQGRDGLFIARQGHSVVGVDLSPNGIRDLHNAAIHESLAIEGVVADISTYNPVGDFDIVLIDRTLHMLTKEARLDALNRLICVVRSGGWVLIADEPSNISDFKTVFEASGHVWRTELEKGGYFFLQRS